MATPTRDVQGVRKYFYFVKEEVSSDWKDLAIHLGFKRADINNIARRNEDDKSCCMDLLEEWLKRNGERATIEVLMEALSEAGLLSTVDGLKGKYAEIQQHSSSRLTGKRKGEDTPEPVKRKKQTHLKEEPPMEDTPQASISRDKGEKEPSMPQRSSSRLKRKRESRDQLPLKKQAHLKEDPPIESLDEESPGTSQDRGTVPQYEETDSEEPQYSSEMPTRYQFYYIKDNAGLQWKDLARMLWFSEPDIDVFEHKHRDPRDSCMEMLTRWQERTSGKATTRVLKDALKEAKLQNIADNLDFHENMYEVPTLRNYRAMSDPFSDNEREQEKQKREIHKAEIDSLAGGNLGKEMERVFENYLEKNYPGLKRQSQAAASAAVHDRTVATTSDDPVGTSLEGSTEEPSLRFHVEVHGTQVRIERNGTVARSRDSFNNSICFSERPIEIGEKINLKITDSKSNDNSLRFGFTSRDPDLINVTDLPPHSYPDLAERPKFWVKPLPGNLAHQGCVVTFSVEEAGKVTFAVDGEDKGVFVSGVDVSKPLWAVVDVHGSAVAVQFVDEQAADEAFDQWIHERDEVQLRDLQMEKLRDMQEDHGGFVAEMMEAMGEVGIVGRIDNDGDMHVFFPRISKGWRISPAVLRKVKKPDIRANTIFGGDLVKITEDLDKLKSVQQEKSLWEDGMEKALGKIARVRGIKRQNGDIAVRVAGEDWVFNPQVVQKAEIQEKMCDQDLHLWKRGVSKVCVKCGECTTAGAKCSMKDKPLRPSGSCCGCSGADAGCADCGICRTCAGEESDDDSALGLLAHAFAHAVTKVTLEALFSGSLTSGGSQDESSERFKKGDLVRLMKDEEKLKDLQKGHGGYVAIMQHNLGKTGCVRKARQRMVQVEFLHMTKSFWYNPAALTSVSSEELETVHPLKAGDCVKVAVDAETLRANQHGHGGYVDSEPVGKVGVVQCTDLDGDCFTCFLTESADFRYLINPASLEKVNPEDYEHEDSSELKKGEFVKVDADRARIKQVQTATVDWDDAFYAASGKIGTMTSIEPSDNIAHVSIEDTSFPLHVALIKRATLADLQEYFSLSRGSEFARGDLVRISVSLEELKGLQEGHGGYKPDMEKVMSEAGSVCFIDSEGDIYVRFNNERLYFNPAALSKETAAGDKFCVGDLVLIESDPSQLKTLQTKEHGGYVEEMAEACGKTGRLLSIMDGNKIRVKVQGKKWIFNPDLLSRIGNPRAVTADWKSATICARGKHDWSKGRPLVCVVCGECTNDGKLCPKSASLNRTRGSIVTGCVYDGHAGCDDCGCCKRCAGEDMEEQDLLESDEFKDVIKKTLKEEADKRLAVDDIKTIVTKHRLSQSSGQLKEGRKKMLDWLDKMGQTIEQMRNKKNPDSIQQLINDVGQHIAIPRSESKPAEKKQIGDYLANIGAAEALMEYIRFLSSQEVQSEGTDKKHIESCRKYLYDISNGFANESVDFGHAVGRSGLLQMTVQELARRQEMEQSDVNQEWIRTLVCILGNSARMPENLDYLRDIGAENPLKKQLSNVDMVFRVVILSCLSHFVDDEKLDTIQIQAADVEFFVNTLSQAVGDAKHEYVGYTSEAQNLSWLAVDLVRDLTALARHDGNKHEFVRNGVMKPLIQLIESGNNTEKECAMLCVQRFAMVDSIRDGIVSETRVEEVLRALLTQQDQIYALQAAARKTLKCLGKEPTSS